MKFNAQSSHQSVIKVEDSITPGDKNVLLLSKTIAYKNFIVKSNLNKIRLSSKKNILYNKIKRSSKGILIARAAEQNTNSIRT